MCFLLASALSRRIEVLKSLEADPVFRNITVFKYLKNKVRMSSCAACDFCTHVEIVVCNFSPACSFALSLILNENHTFFK